MDNHLLFYIRKARFMRAFLVLHIFTIVFFGITFVLNLNKSFNTSIMQAFLSILSTILLLFLNMGCASIDTMDQTPPISLIDAYYQELLPNGEAVSLGYSVTLPSRESKENIISHLYFKDKKIDLQYDSTIKAYTGRYIFPIKEDLIMSDDPTKEFGNKLPVIEKKIPFDLKNNEAVLAYEKDSKMIFFKIDNLPKKM